MGHILTEFDLVGGALDLPQKMSNLLHTVGMIYKRKSRVGIKKPPTESGDASGISNMDPFYTNIFHQVSVV